MPRGDGTEPYGTGPARGKTLTGAVCASPLSSEAGLDDLRDQVGYLQKTLEEIKRRIQELEMIE